VRVICLDIGTTAIKAAAFETGRRRGAVRRRSMPMHLTGRQAELDAGELLRLTMDLIRRTAETFSGKVDRICIAAMAPAICLLDGRQRPITPIICHLDRRSQREALQLIDMFGGERLLRTTGNLPFPGGIASTTLRWLQVHAPETYRRAAKVVPITTLIVSRLTGRTLCNPGSAAFLGTYEIRSMRPWQPMVEFLDLRSSAMPDVADGGDVAGRIRSGLAAELALRSRPQVLVGLMDTSAVCLEASLRVGHLYNAIGTTDVLAICTDAPKPTKGVLTRPVGTSPLWLAVNTMAAVGAALQWTRKTFFADKTEQEFYALVNSIGETQRKASVRFEPDLAGSRMHVRQRFGTIKGLTLATSREDILAALLGSLARRSARRLRLLSRQATPAGTVFVAGRASKVDLHRFWPDRYRIVRLPADASLRGLAKLAAGSKGIAK